MKRPDSRMSADLSVGNVRGDVHRQRLSQRVAEHSHRREKRQGCTSRCTEHAVTEYVAVVASMGHVQYLVGTRRRGAAGLLRCDRNVGMERP